MIKHLQLNSKSHIKIKNVVYKDQNYQTQNISTPTTPSQDGSTTLFTPEQLSKFKAMQAAGIR